jgi:hypothetical protein
MTRLPLDAHYREPYPVPAQACPRCGVVMRTLGALRLHLDRERDPAERLALHRGYELVPDPRGRKEGAA